MMIISLIKKDSNLVVRRDIKGDFSDYESMIISDFSHLIPLNTEVTLYDYIVSILNNYKGERTYSVLRSLLEDYGIKLSDYDHIIKGIK